MVVGMWVVKAGELDERRPDSGAKSPGCGRMNPHSHELYYINSPGDG